VLGLARNAARAQARGAHFNRSVRSAIVDPDRLQVGQPAAARLIHRVADVIAGHRTFAANFAALCHGAVPFRERGTTPG
jgi:hypothetical protein